MKKVFITVLGIWCAIAWFISPIWLTMIFLNMTGEIYKYDPFMDEGTAGILGTISLVIWGFLVLLPNIFFAKAMYALKRKYLFIALGVMGLLAVICIAICGWDIVGFLTTPGGMK